MWRRVRWIVLAVLVLALVGEGTSAYLVSRTTNDAQARARAAHAQVDADLAAASKVGYTDDDLVPTRRAVEAVAREVEPILPWERPGFYDSQAARYRGADSGLKQAEAQIDATAKQDLDQQVTASRAGLDQDKSLDVPDSVLTPLASRFDAIVKAQAGASSIVDLRKADGDARKLTADITAAGQAQQAENAVIQAAATTLLQQQSNNADAIKKAAATALAQGRNDATIAAYEAKPGRFAAIDKVMDAYSRMEHYNGRLGATDVTQVAFGAAAIQRYAGQIHDLLMQNLGPKHVVVSFEGQHVWAYEGAKVVMDTAATTGIRGVTDYGTDFGPMKVLYTEHPHTMHSPYPKGSPYWYPDTVVQWTVFFTNSGESFHDASWEPDWLLGPGSQYDPSTRSHGCVHIPYSLAQWMYGWADVGTPVDVVPYDGKPVSDQLAEMTTDDQGNPLNPA